jgi:hypothetical protein
LTKAQYDLGLSALRTGCLCPQESSWFSSLFQAESTPGP